MITALSSRVESNYLLIVASGKIVTKEEYRLLVKRYCDEIINSGLKKIIIDETNVDYVLSFILQSEIVEYYSSGELSEEFNTWRIACIGSPDAKVFFDFWEHVARESGYDQKAFTSIDAAREFMKS